MIHVRQIKKRPFPLFVEQSHFEQFTPTHEFHIVRPVDPLQSNTQLIPFKVFKKSKLVLQFLLRNELIMNLSNFVVQVSPADDGQEVSFLSVGLDAGHGLGVQPLPFIRNNLTVRSLVLNKISNYSQ